ncbi:alkaline phosphatase D family protein [Pleomorphovibrio marinus]|uniref:alkaline phosphatase D family protein n=1 Tax=Pleomorphovibrio marinus TaxID=2164132 RepID=UPI000E0B05B1|nr:alkaline phosphatase D family protein [Pleomorphovibrio marinus]
MKRRKAVKVIAVGGMGSTLLPSGSYALKTLNKPLYEPLASTFKSDWNQWPNLDWIGPEYWGNRLQDWKIVEGKATCMVSGKNRTLYHLGMHLSDRREGFSTSVNISFLNREDIGASAEDYAAFRLGAKGRFDDYRSAAVFGQGLDCGLTRSGRLFIGEKAQGSENVDLSQEVHLKLQVFLGESGFRLRLEALDTDGTGTLASLEYEALSADLLEGQIALVSHVDGEKERNDLPSANFSSWVVTGEKLDHNPERQFGPICFAYYTLHKNELRLTAQMAPIENFVHHKIFLEVKRQGEWETLLKGKINRLGRVARFVLRDWDSAEEVAYRVRVDLPFSSGVRPYFYEGVIAKEPVEQDAVKMAVFSCNVDHGFPDQEVVDNVGKHRADLAVFLGDQFYESTGGFGIEISPLERSSLDYLRKWYMFGWSYREIFRNIPAIFIPDDHDVYHGNVWGEGGKKAPTDEGWNYAAQDQGGYKMPPEWVNMVQLTQTGHLPEPYDPSPLIQGIGSYYTDWVYGGISMAVLEDRKFKTAPKNILPEEAKVLNGFIQNPEFDIKAHYDIDAHLLGDRQMEFLEKWASDWEHGVEMKVALSQTNFCTAATLPKGSIIDSIVPRLPIPKPGEYVEGDAPTTDMDSNGWPQKERDQTLRLLRKAFALHIAGDQHLATIIHHGIDEFGDAGFAFAGPALNNIFPRRWWPPIPENHQPLEGQPLYTGNFHDGFGNKMTVHAVANPTQTGREPAIIYDRSTGYGMVTFNKRDRTMKMECWPRYVDPEKEPDGQYTGWPKTISQEQNYARKEIGYLPEVVFKSVKSPVISVINEADGELVFALRVGETSFTPKVFEAGTYTVIVRDTENNTQQVFEGVGLSGGQSPAIMV